MGWIGCEVIMNGSRPYLSDIMPLVNAISIRNKK